MTYRQLYEDAMNKLGHGEITVGEYEKMIEPLNHEIKPEHAKPKQKRDKCDRCTYSRCTFWDKIDHIDGGMCPLDKAGIRKGVRREGYHFFS